MNVWDVVYKFQGPKGRLHEFHISCTTRVIRVRWDSFPFLINSSPRAFSFLLHPLSRGRAGGGRGGIEGNDPLGKSTSNH